MAPRPRTAGDLLASHTPVTAFSGDDDDAEDEGDEDAGSSFVPTPLLPERQQQQSEGSEAEYEGRQEFQELLEDAQDDEMGLTDYQRYWRRLQWHVLHRINQAWQLEGPTRQAAAMAGQWVRAGQHTGSHLTQLYAARHLGLDFRPFDPGPDIIERPFVDKLELYSRPIRETSLAAQLSRLETLANTDLQLAKTRTLYSAFDEDQRVNRRPIKTWRRVPGGDNPCALCEIAADQIYFSDDLMAIHDNCMCDVEEADESDLEEHDLKRHHIGFVETLLDTGQQVGAIRTLADEDAPPEAYHNLVEIRQHGELGPVITWRGQDFTGPEDLPTPLPVRPVPTVSGPGEAHEARIARNRARVEQYRQQHFGPGGRRIPQYAPGAGVGSSYLPPVPKTFGPIPKPVEPAVPKPGPRPTVLGKVTVVINPDGTMTLQGGFKPKTGIDWDNAKFDDLLDHMATKHASQVPRDSWREGGLWSFGYYNEQGRRNLLQAIDEMLDKYPDVRVGKFTIARLDPGTIAETAYDPRITGKVAEVRFNADLLHMTPSEMKQYFKAAEDTKHFFTGSSQDPYRAMVYHEYGHVLDVRGGKRASDTAGKALLEVFRASPEGREALREWPINYTDPQVIQERNMRQQLRILSKWMAKPDRVSGYSMWDQVVPGQISAVTGKPGGVALRGGEAVAQAFDDVERRGDAASDVSKRLHDSIIEEYKKDWPPAEGLHPMPTAALRVERERTAIEQLRQATEKPLPWTEEEIAREDNHAISSTTGKEILTDQDRAYARELAEQIYRKAVRAEPDITSTVVSSTKTHGGYNFGLDFRLKTMPSLYRKIQAEAIKAGVGDDTMAALDKAANDIKDAVRYTALMPQEGYWASGDGLRKALESLGAKVIKDPIGIPYNGYRGRNMAFILNGAPFELQVNTELGQGIKDVNHVIYNVTRKLEVKLREAGIDPLTDPEYKKMWDSMQENWDLIPIAKGTPVVADEEKAKRGTEKDILWRATHTAIYGPTVPDGEVALDNPWYLHREKEPVVRYGMNFIPDREAVVSIARAQPEDVWNEIPVTMLPHGTPLEATEPVVTKRHIDRVVKGEEPFREGYVTKLWEQTDKNGNKHLFVVDGHHRVAMYNALGKDMPVRIMDENFVRNLDVPILGKEKLETPPPAKGFKEIHRAIKTDLPADIVAAVKRGDPDAGEKVLAFMRSYQGGKRDLGMHWSKEDWAAKYAAERYGHGAHTVRVTADWTGKGIYRGPERKEMIGAGPAIKLEKEVLLNPARIPTEVIPTRVDVWIEGTKYTLPLKDIAVPEEKPLVREQMTGLTADKKGWGSVLARLPDGETIKPKYMIKGHHRQVDVAGTWARVSDDTLKENWRNALRQSRQWAIRAGQDWYPGVHRMTEEMVKDYGAAFEKRWGTKLTPDLAAAIIASYSENNRWAGNLVGARKFMDGTGTEFKGKLKDFNYDEARDYAGIKAGKYGTKYSVPFEGKGRKGGYTIPGYPGRWANYDYHVNKALRAMQNPAGGVADFRENDVTAPKPADFAANIAGDYSKATADRWVARILLHTDDGEFAEQMRGFTKETAKVPDRIGYKRMSKALMDVAAEPEFSEYNAAAVQAIPWIQVVGPLGSIGEIDDLSSYGTVTAETLRKAAEFGEVE